MSSVNDTNSVAELSMHDHNGDKFIGLLRSAVNDHNTDPPSNNPDCYKRVISYVVCMCKIYFSARD